MPRKPKTHIQAALDHQKRQAREEREAKRKSKRAVQTTLPHVPRPKRPKKTKWVQLTIDHAIQRFNEGQRHVELLGAQQAELLGIQQAAPQGCDRADCAPEAQAEGHLPAA